LNGSGDKSAFEFETRRLLLRPLEAVDEALFCGLYTDVDTMRFIGDPLTLERAARSFRKAVASWSKDPLDRAFLTVLEKATQRPLGICAIVRFQANMTSAEVGIMLKADARSRGYAREGLGGLVQRTFRLFPVDEIRVECSALNPVVERMVNSIGFRLCDNPATKVGPLLQRSWSVHRSSSCFVNTVNNRGEDNV
jgi:RimJ/RimL family protein N-acetyltransferase